VKLVVEREGDWLALRVMDRGAGVPEPERERIFEPFYRARGVGNVGGTGLGLSIAKRIAQEQAGDLRYSPAPDGGSCFTLLLPAADLTADLSL
jgi:signal transduction histidine kinase